MPPRICVQTDMAGYLLRFDVFDIDNDSEDMDDHDYIGHFETSLQDILWSKNRKISGNLISSKRGFSGKIILMVDEIIDIPKRVTSSLYIQLFESLALKLITSFQRTIFFEINRQRKGIKYLVRHIVPISLGTLCNGDFYQDFVIQLFVFSKNGDHSLLGTTKASIIELNNITDITSRFLIVTGECGRSGLEDIGHLFVKECQIIN
ncbi:hypothetical protein K493DRAFT_403808 [Basidiobolus meristosporus CBS 931.73]|uniref:Uncharacterized protein n=1 Tax=Basidiobolus meristosporus CBS 931.73 TaxID=1314790 RepID=A0A1Y1Z9X1_9FUNG|nr:hypothetical protein K493DRAFT_403808 [Basidiobolus meristosporus CBS 931.73]|eukprot:ORY07078.1 hypothetical protein K493DRAFT_403808 [Basidiobolus meristosporus CBS 931.73]